MHCLVLIFGWVWEKSGIIINAGDSVIAWKWYLKWTCWLIFEPVNWIREHLLPRSWHRVRKGNIVLSVIEAFLPGLFRFCCLTVGERNWLSVAADLTHAVEIITSESCSIITPHFSSLCFAKQYLHYLLHLISNIVSQKPDIKISCFFFLRAFQNFKCKIWAMTSSKFCKQFPLSVLNTITRVSSSLLVWYF